MKKVAIVTGASRGIGRAVAKRLAIDGFGVVVNYLNNRAEAEQVVAELKVDRRQCNRHSRRCCKSRGCRALVQ